MKKQQYISPACVVVEMEMETELLAMSQTNGTDIGQRPGQGGSGGMDAAGDNKGHYDIWED